MGGRFEFQSEIFGAFHFASGRLRLSSLVLAIAFAGILIPLLYVFVIGRKVDVRLVSLRSGDGGSDRRGEGDALTGVSFDEDELASSVSSLSLTAL